MRIKPLIALAIFAVGTYNTTAYALPSDSQQPIHIQADKADLDNNKGVLVYRGNVIITQGTMKVMGHTVTIVRNKDGGVDVMTSQGSPAYFEQIPSANEPMIKAYGSMIQYQTANKKIVLEGNAKVIQKNNTFNGSRMVYDTEKGTISAVGGTKTTTGSTSKGGRINMVLEPEKKKQ
ncbi:lipopolysaccharide transport periplasmic protein LptA [Entomomonas moraniae]|uniref:Lipopolysaccharide export system protein LptA n=1 Tax=Entomomonas moraniae TaxID=2213226 RepID=A0A3Q9JHG9_9GAMM|nr:lipopolysaccharide transport periplasmic protein LptA [Entomomonas moraniae]AZS49578.1 lipopolysaccharide transport periplasmic protein LptA [Entomomonas moraniae]